MWFAVHLIVATPGRILDLLNKELVKTDGCKTLVLDEVRWLFTVTVIVKLILLWKMPNVEAAGEFTNVRPWNM